MAETNSKTEYVVGVDVGGARILGGVFNSGLKCVATAKVSTKTQRGIKAVVERVSRCVREAVDEADLSLKDLQGGAEWGVPGVFKKTLVIVSKLGDDAGITGAAVLAQQEGL